MGENSNLTQTAQPVLKPEVEPPYKASNGLGILFVAGASMFFAVASSAFIVRASLVRNHRTMCTHSSTAIPTTPVTLFNRVDNKDCGKAVFRKRANGTTSVIYKLCR